jgi:predicted metal-dependent HD superfamily phosphohydrolase
LNSKFQTLFLIPPKNLAEVSSSLVKQLVGPQGWEKVVKSYVPEPVYKKVLHHELLANFQLVWAKLSGNPDLAKQKAPEILTTLIDHYLETHRHYHNISHILDCCNELSSLQQISPDDYYRLYVALWFHDVIYDTKAKDNEQKSADLFVKMATDSQFNAGDIQIINDLILATQTHVGKTQLEVLMLDIDLSILGRDIETFDCYDLDIRKEYHWVPDDAYEAGRKKIMNGFFLRAKIFQTKEFSDRYEAQAKENLKKFNT